MVDGCKKYLSFAKQMVGNVGGCSIYVLISRLGLNRKDPTVLSVLLNWTKNRIPDYHREVVLSQI